MFRLLAYEYLDRTDLVHVQDPNRVSQEEETQRTGIIQVRITAPQPTQKQKAASVAPTPVNTAAQNTADIKKLMGTSADAPACRNCGNITMRNGTCYMCPNCGTTTGCS